MSGGTASLLLAQGLVEYGAASGIAASAQRAADGLLSSGSEHLPLILFLLAGLVVLWGLLGRKRA